MDRRKLNVLLRHRAAMAGLGLLAAFALLALLIGLFSPYDPADDKVGTFLAPSSQHWFGTDNFGRDTLTRIGFAARISLLIGAACTAFSLGIGIPLGAVAGYFGGWIDTAVSRLIDILLSFPSIILAIAIAAPLGASLETVIIAIGVVGVPQFARQVRASVIELREREFVTASRALGAGDGRILFRAILPNAMGPIIVLSTLGVGTAILSAAGLSFIGLGVEPGTAEWGVMLRDGFDYRNQSPYLGLFSGLAISLAVLGFNLFGDGLRDALDPKSRAVR